MRNIPIRAALSIFLVLALFVAVAANRPAVPPGVRIVGDGEASKVYGSQVGSCVRAKYGTFCEVEKCGITNVIPILGQDPDDLGLYKIIEVKCKTYEGCKYERPDKSMPCSPPPT